MVIHDPDWPRADVWMAQEAENPDIRVVGVPSSSASLSPSHADLTPLAVRERFGRFSTFHGEWGIDFGSVTVYDEGNWPVSPLDMYEMPARVESLARDLDPAALTLFLGGDNAITRPLVNARREQGEIGLLTFDAHHDVRTLELGPANGTPIRGLIDEDGLTGSAVSQIGIHSFANSAIYRGYCDAMGIVVRTIDDIESTGIEAVVTAELSRLSAVCSTIYVDVDIDVLDASLAPACPGSRPGGMSVRDLAQAVRLAAAHPQVVAMDFVEVDAEADVDGRTLDVMAHLILSSCAGFAERIQAG